MTQLKVGLRVRDLEASCALYLKLGFKQIPRQTSRACAT
jgi:lactoylglutathione lyase